MMRRLVAAVMALVLLLGVAGPAAAVGPCALYRSWNTGDQLTAPDLTTSFTTVGINNMVFTCLDDYSTDATQMGTVTDPYPSGVASLATTGAGELERLRYAIKAATGWSQWYAHSDSFARALGTITTDKQILGGTATWNAGGVTFTAVKFDVTDTASAAASKLLDLKVAGVSKFTVDKAGAVTVGSAPLPAGMIALVDATLGACPSGWAEVTAARGRHIVGLPASGTMEGTVGSAMTDQQNLSVTPTFAGNALATHQHTTTLDDIGANLGGHASAAFGSSGGTHTVGREWTTAASSGSSAFDLTSAVSAGTPAGTVSAVTGGALAPYIQLLLCKKS